MIYNYGIREVVYMKYVGIIVAMSEEQEAVRNLMEQIFESN